jgi:RNA polymerase sigma factor (sigma-70 family)
MSTDNCTADTNQKLLWTHFRNGDADAFNHLIQAYYQDLYNYGIKFIKEPEFVKDCIQELFLYVWVNKASISEVAGIKYYLIKSLRHKLNREHEKGKRLKIRELVFDAGISEEMPVESHIIMEEHALEQAKKIRIIISRLSKRQQEIIYLRFYMDLEMDEIADVMLLNRQSAYNLLHEALKKMKESSGKGHLPKLMPFSGILMLLLGSLQ